MVGLAERLTMGVRAGKSSGFAVFFQPECFHLSNGPAA